MIDRLICPGCNVHLLDEGVPDVPIPGIALGADLGPDVQDEDFRAGENTFCCNCGAIVTVEPDITLRLASDLEVERYLGKGDTRWVFEEMIAFVKARGLSVGPTLS